MAKAVHAGAENATSARRARRADAETGAVTGAGAVTDTGADADAGTDAGTELNGEGDIAAGACRERGELATVMIAGARGGLR
ncbi:MAG: hypothetical protein L6Q76_23520 [Polyangiaceae bacterium]|nr:hypothetical protein [Polyangiaceae bacterium]